MLLTHTVKWDRSRVKYESDAIQNQLRILTQITKKLTLFLYQNENFVPQFKRILVGHWNVTGWTFYLSHFNQSNQILSLKVKPLGHRVRLPVGSFTFLAQQNPTHGYHSLPLKNAVWSSHSPTIGKQFRLELFNRWMELLDFRLKIAQI